MKKKITNAIWIIAVAVLCLGIISAIIQNELEMKYISERDGEIQIVDYSMLNVRSKPGEQSDIITIIESGDTVELTGNYKKMSIGGRDDDTWAEVKIIKDWEGNVITGEEISDVQDGAEFTFFFGWVTTDGIKIP